MNGKEALRLLNMQRIIDGFKGIIQAKNLNIPELGMKTNKKWTFDVFKSKTGKFAIRTKSPIGETKYYGYSLDSQLIKATFASSNNARRRTIRVLQELAKDNGCELNVYVSKNGKTVANYIDDYGAKVYCGYSAEMRPIKSVIKYPDKSHEVLRLKI